MITTYVWNVALCEALYPALNALEVSLRNAIHTAASTFYSTEFWFDRPNVLKLRQPREISTARAELNRRGKPATAGRIIAELRFGFWTSLLSGPYHDSFWMLNKATMLETAFPHLQTERLRKRIHTRYNTLRYLRNRVFHYEPIWNRPNLLPEHGQMLEAISWVSPQLWDLITLSDRFLPTYHGGQAQLQATVQAYLARNS